MRLRSRVIAIILAGTASASWIVFNTNQAATSADLSSLHASDENSTLVLDHSAWTAFLVTYVHRDAEGIARLDYAGVTDGNRRVLDDYITSLEAIDVEALSRREQLPFWINLYNAATLRLVLEHYPVASIRDIDTSPGLFSNGPWGEKVVVVKGEDLSLDNIEHDIIRTQWDDPRIHYGLNCAALGCPNLQNTAFTSENIDGLLSLAAGRFINHARGAHLADNRIEVSSLFYWYSDDFGDLRSHLLIFAAPELHAFLESGMELVEGDYDWSLNDASGGAGGMERPMSAGSRRAL